MKTSIMKPEFMGCLLWKMTADHPNTFVLGAYPGHSTYVVMLCWTLQDSKDEKDYIPPHSVLQQSPGVVLWISRINLKLPELLVSSPLLINSQLILTACSQWAFLFYLKTLQLVRVKVIATRESEKLASKSNQNFDIMVNFLVWHQIRFYYSARSCKSLQKPFEQKHENQAFSSRKNFSTQKGNKWSSRIVF